MKKDILIDSDTHRVIYHPEEDRVSVEVVCVDQLGDTTLKTWIHDCKRHGTGHVIHCLAVQCHDQGEEILLGYKRQDDLNKELCQQKHMHISELMDTIKQKQTELEKIEKEKAELAKQLRNAMDTIDSMIAKERNHA